MKAKTTGTGHFSGGFGVFQVEGGGVACKWELVKYPKFRYTIKLDNVAICSFRAQSSQQAKQHFNSLLDSKALAVQHPPKTPTPGAIRAQQNALKTSGGALRHIVRSGDPAEAWQLLTEVCSEGAKTRFNRIKKRAEGKTATESEMAFFRLYRAVEKAAGKKGLFKIWAAANWDRLPEIKARGGLETVEVSEAFASETGLAEPKQDYVRFALCELRK